MGKTCFAALALLVAVCSCNPGSKARFKRLDEAIERQEYYDLLHSRKHDSLRNLLLAAPTDSARWEAAYNLEKINFYHNMDSCYRYTREMIRLQGDDIRRRTISRACLANILVRMDSISTATSILESIDTTALDHESTAIYCFAGHHIYRTLALGNPGIERKRRQIIDMWWRSDSTNVECAFYHNLMLPDDEILQKSLPYLLACPLVTPNDTAKANYCIAKEYLRIGMTEKAIQHLTISATYDMRVSAKAYSSLYELARILFRIGDIKRADRYMRVTLQDAQSSHFVAKYNNIVNSELEIMNVLLLQQRQKEWAYFITILSVVLLLIVALASLLLLARYSSRLSQSRKKLNEVSNIKDRFMALYMEKCVDYLNKVDEYRSSLRRSVKQEGAEAALAMLRKPSFAGQEFDELLSSFDAAFLGIFPDFVKNVNSHMQEQYRLEQPSEGKLSTELRILALIKMGIAKRPRIAKVLNMSVTTVYSYHSNLRKHSLHPDSSFDKVIASC